MSGNEGRGCALRTVLLLLGAALGAGAMWEAGATLLSSDDYDLDLAARDAAITFGALVVAHAGDLFRRRTRERS
jgi:hypothetical protein